MARAFSAIDSKDESVTSLTVQQSSTAKVRAWRAANPERNKALNDAQYAKNKERIKANSRRRYAEKCELIKKQNRERQRARKLWALGILGGKCTRCPQDHPAALDFHHLDPSRKTAHLVDMLSRPKKYPDHLILAELAGCEILCKNCHAVEHYGDE